MPKLRRSRTIRRDYARKQWRHKRVSEITYSISEEEESIHNVEDFVEALAHMDKVKVDDMADLVELMKEKIGLKFISVLLFMTLRHFEISWNRCDEFFKNIGLLTVKTSKKWTDIFVSRNLDEFLCDGRGGKHVASFYDIFPDIELSAKSYSVQRCSEKKADFDASELAKFIDSEFYEITSIEKSFNDLPIRSVQSCRLDLRKWGACFKANSQRPYFEGHERPDVVQHREQFLEYFLSRKDKYYLVSEGEMPQWKNPTIAKPSILLCMFQLTQRKSTSCNGFIFYYCFSS